jgi:hypothetical protein
VFSWLKTVHALNRAAVDEADKGLAWNPVHMNGVFVCLAIRRVAVNREGSTLTKEPQTDDKHWA